MMKMSTWWMFTLLVGCRSPLGARSGNTCACNDQLKTVCVPAGGKVSVPCPKPQGKEVKFHLRQDGEVTHDYNCSDRGGAWSCEPLLTGDGAELHGHPANKSVSFVLTGVTAGSHGVYRCEGAVVVPPPLKMLASDSGVLLLVEGHQCKQDCRDRITAGEQEGGLHWIYIVVVVSSYGVIVTITAIVIRVKSRTESQGEYMNTKPRAAQVHRRKRGDLNPIPRHF